MSKKIFILSLGFVGILLLSGCNGSVQNGQGEKNNQNGQIIKNPDNNDQNGRGAGIYEGVEEYSIIDENLGLVIPAGWQIHENSEYGYSFQYPNNFICEVDTSVRDCTAEACKAPPAGLDLNTITQNRVVCRSTCEIEPGATGCIPPQISISTYPNSENWGAQKFCQVVGFYEGMCERTGLNFEVDGKQAVRYGFKYVPEKQTNEPVSVNDYVYVSAGNKNYVIQSETELNNVEARRWIEGIISSIDFE